MSPRRRAIVAAGGNAVLLAPAWALSPARAFVHVWVVVGLATIFAAVEAACATADDRTDRVLPIGPTLTALALLATIVVSLLSAAAQVSAAEMTIGASVAALGILLRAAAMRTLGGAFVTQTRPSAALVRHGPYRWLRHPSELGLLAIAVGITVIAGSVAALWVVAMALAPIVVVRTQLESRELSRFLRSPQAGSWQTTSRL